MSKMFRVTYEIVTPESAEQGDAAERGFIMPGEWKYAIEEALKEPDNTFNMTLREAVDLIGCVYDSGSWFTESDGRDDYRTGANERRDLHPPRNITASSYARVKRLLKA